MTNSQQRIAILRGAIGHARCVISEDHQPVESQAIARANLAKYQAELATLATLVDAA